MRDPDPPPVDDDPAEGNWHPPLEKDPPIPQRIAREFAETPPDETGTQAFWRQTLRHKPMPVTGQRAGEGATSDTAQLPPPFAPAVDPLKHNVDVPAPMPGQTGGTLDKGNKLPPAAPPVPGTQDRPFHKNLAPPPQDPNEILYTEADDDAGGYTGPSLGGHWGAVNV